MPPRSLLILGHFSSREKNLHPIREVRRFSSLFWILISFLRRGQLPQAPPMKCAPSNVWLWIWNNQSNDLTLWMSKSVRTMRLRWNTKNTHILKRNYLWSDRLHFWGTQGYTNYLTIRKQHTSPTCLQLYSLQHPSWCLVAFWFIPPNNLQAIPRSSLSCFSPKLLPPVL